MLPVSRACDAAPGPPIVLQTMQHRDTAVLPGRYFNHLGLWSGMLGAYVLHELDSLHAHPDCYMPSMISLHVSFAWYCILGPTDDLPVGSICSGQAVFAKLQATCVGHCMHAPPGQQAMQQSTRCTAQKLQATCRQHDWPPQNARSKLLPRQVPDSC